MVEINSSNYEACIARIAARGKINPREAEALLEEVAEAAERQRRTGSEDPIVTAAWQLARDLKSGAEQKKGEVLLNARVRIDRAGEATQSGTLKKAMNSLRGTFFWLAGEPNKENVQSLWHGLSTTWNSTLYAKLNKAGLAEAARDPAMFQSVANEIYKLRTGMATIELPNESPTRQIAEIIFENQEAQRARLNSAGARIADAKDWIATTSHDSYLMRRGGRTTNPAINVTEARDRWIENVRDRLDEKTFDDVTPNDNETMAQARDRYLKTVFDALYTGQHDKIGSDGPKFEAGGFNIAKKLSEGRSLFWKDADAWSGYMAEYGRYQNWLHLAVSTGDYNAKRAALMKFWGTNPASNLRLVMENIANKYRDSDPDGVVNFLKERSGFVREDIRDVMKLLDGTADRPANEMAAQIGRTAKAFSNMAYLGGVQLTHFSSLFATVGSDALMHGDGVWSSLGQMIGSMFKSLKAEDRTELLAELGAYGDSLKRHVEDHFGHGMSLTKEEMFGVPGAIAQAQDWYMTATGLPYVFDHVRAGRKGVLANKYARALDKDFADLKAPEQKLLNSYGIGADEWALLKTGDLTEAEGRQYMTPNITATVDRSGIEALLRARGELKDGASREAIDKAIFGFRDDLADKITMLYRDAAELSVVSAGVRQEAMIRGSSAAGTFRAEVMGAVAQFHSWPIAAVHQVLARQFYENAGAQRVFNLGIVAGLSLLGGYIRATVRDLANGVEPRVPRTVGEAARLGIYWMGQGGGAGIIGDWIGGELARSPTPGGYGESGGGPLLSMGNEAIHILTTLAQEVDNPSGKKIDIWGDLAKHTLGHIPVANLLYLKTAANYLLLWHAYEAMKPGWWQRTNSAMQKEQGRTYYGYHPYQPPPSPFR